jgi:hypothetical protein
MLFTLWVFNSVDGNKHFGISKFRESLRILEEGKKELEIFSEILQFSKNYTKQIKSRPGSELFLTNEKISEDLIIINKYEIDWKNTNLKRLSVLQINNYLLWSNHSACQICQYFGGFMVSSAIGRIFLDGQKAICLDNQVKPIGAVSGVSRRCLVYSFGINNEWSFDEAMELYGCEVFAFDPSMNVSNHNRTKNIHFYQMALDNEDKEGWLTFINTPTRTLTSIYEMLKPVHEDNIIIDYLKIDIESTEWRVLPHILRSGMINKVRQLSVEIHMDYDKSATIYHKQASILQSIEEHGMIRFDSKPNMHSMIILNNNSLFSSFEISWYNVKLQRYFI